MKKREKGKNRQVFLCTLGFCLFFFLTAAGLLTVDQEGRRLSFGDQAPALQTVEKPGGKQDLQIRFWGRETEVDITWLAKSWDFFLDFTCIPHS